jgi:adenylate cyclase class 2
MLEIEMKFRVSDFAVVEQRLRDWQPKTHATIAEADHYFNAPDRDFGQTDEAFRLRRIGTNNRVTYKGPKQPGPTKTRTELELSLADGLGTADEFCALVQHLGYRPTAIVRKQRTTHDIHRDGFDLQICFDEVERLGRFIEVEIVAEESRRDQAQQVLMQVARALGLDQIEPRAYLRMVLSLDGKE